MQLDVDFFDDAFGWHPRYLPPRVEAGRLLLASETELFMLQSEGVLALAPVLRERASLAQLCRAGGVPPLLASMLHALEQLAREGFVLPVRALPEAGRYLVPDFARPFAGEDRAIVLSEAVDADDALHWVRALQSDIDFTLVVCDDYLDPRLGRIDAQHRAAGRAWLPVQPTGEQSMVGPLFTPATACWHCLAHRLARNRPARAWWRALQGGQEAGFPVRADAALVAQRMERLRDPARELLRHAGQQIHLLESMTSSSTHEVTRRPQCPHCGDPGWMARLQREPIALEACLRTDASDGGFRSVPASATVERLGRHLSPLTGVIARVAPLGVEAEDGLTVYRSEIFRTPPTTGDPFAVAMTQVCLGKGLSMQQSRASAMCEAVERYSAHYQGDEALVIARAEELDGRWIEPRELAFFSERQRPAHAPAASTTNAVAWWAPAWSLTNAQLCYLPFGYCHAHAPPEAQQACNWTSNGSAAGNTREEAILQGFLELVERDAAAIWWYNEIERPAFDLRGLAVTSLQRIAQHLGPSWDYSVLDLTHDFGIPVAAAVGRHHRTGDWAIGFGCSPDAALACERALTEMCQLIAAGKTLAVGEDPRFLAPPDGQGVVPLPARDTNATDITATIEHCVRIAAALGLETLVLDGTRPDVPLCTVKVVVPGLCHIWPELGNPRLYRVPVAMGWRDAPRREDQLNPQALYV